MKKKKKYGQHFLINKRIIEEIVNYQDLKDKTVIEIGPGEGVLTVELAKVAKEVFAFEIDLDLKPTLVNLSHIYPNVVFYYEDILKVDLEKFHKEHKIDFSALVANIPYYITGPILMLLLNTRQIEIATIMMQKEVGERIFSTSGKDYNALSVLMQTFFEIKVVKKVSKNNFNPPPKVDSIILNFARKKGVEKLIKNEANYKEFIDVSFKQKRKTFVNNLASGFNIEKSIVLEKLLKINANFDPLIRAEKISINEFILYSNEWYDD